MIPNQMQTFKLDCLPGTIRRHWADKAPRPGRTPCLAKLLYPVSPLKESHFLWRRYTLDIRVFMMTISAMLEGLFQFYSVHTKRPAHIWWLRGRSFFQREGNYSWTLRMQENQQTEDRKNSDERQWQCPPGDFEECCSGNSLCVQRIAQGLKAVLDIAFLPRDQWNSINKLVNSLSNLHLSASPLLQKC